ncbi:MAG: hypothetical protein LBL92_00060, partial [Propionibacteriaceae bacterium]|nr:hypothetical protein [Propionibacteriaceae bacterium]
MTTVSGTPPTSPHSPRIDSTSARSWLRRRSVRVASLVSLSLIASLTMTSPARAETSLVPVQVSGIAAVLQSELVADAPHTEVVIETDQGQALPLPATNPLTDVDATTHFTVTLAVPRSVVEQVLGQAPAQVDDPDQANSNISRLNQHGQT